ncbi:hypothetical protein ACPTE9_30110, partial [Pseudomonas aeruginosa]|uniref:hypothetical protein n=1 Tax=Pseudomonas aeruginosa TaxID=287 RepID=UPI003CC5D315
VSNMKAMVWSILFGIMYAANAIYQHYPYRPLAQNQNFNHAPPGNKPHTSLATHDGFFHRSQKQCQNNVKWAIRMYDRI